ncbi:MAG: CehA/McbA family metallohydrolase [Gemmatimonadales bacterium]
MPRLPKRSRRYRLGLTLVATGLLAAAPGARAAAQRRTVLDQIQVPHNYYFREMYLPQVTTGPGWVAWHPNGRTLVYSMAGSLWRQTLGTDEAEQLTDGPGYDYQPDWSPDGKWIVYASYRNGAVELRILDTATGEDRSLIADQTVNLEPRWAPDGSKLAFVSTAYQGRWHIFTLDMAGGQAVGSPRRLTEDRDSKLPRYYYSVWDHYLSPTWSPDGSELLMVSNAGRIWGTGGVWRLPVAGGAPRQLYYEETTWKARPDWSPDGKRVVYSSYLGRQWNQLWLMTSEGGDPFQLTYGDFDATNPRWSPDGDRIAFISNRTGNTELDVVSVPGGRIETVQVTRRRYRTPRTPVTITVADAAGRPQPARISVTGPDGRGYFPADAWAHADDAFDRGVRSFEYTYFHTAGTSRLALPPGRYVIEATRGYEYTRRVDTLTVGSTPVRYRAVVRRLVNLPASGWFSGDLHVHMNYGGHYRNTPEHLRFQARAEDLHVVENLVVNKEQRVPDIASFSGALDPVSDATTLIKHDEEYHTSYWGHTGLIGLTRYFVLPGYASYVNTAAASPYPHNARIFELAHEQSGLAGYVHPFDTFPDIDGGEKTTNGLPIEAALGRLDYYEVVGFSDHFATAEVWYRLLNTGLRIPAGAGTDAMANFASLRGPVGMGRVYAKSGRLDYRAWLAALKAGRTFVTNGPIVRFTLDGRDPGAVIDLPAGGGRLRATASLRSIVAVDSLQVVSNGQVVRSIPVSAGGTSADLAFDLPLERSAWVTLRAFARTARYPTLDLYPFATTSPIYVTVGGAPIRSPEDARFFVRWLDQLAPQVAGHAGWNNEREKAAVLGDIRTARAFFEARSR